MAQLRLQTSDHARRQRRNDCPPPSGDVRRLDGNRGIYTPRDQRSIRLPGPAVIQHEVSTPTDAVSYWFAAIWRG